MIQWFKKHPDYLRRESKALSIDKNYREIRQARSNLFVSHGNIIVRLNKIYRFPFLFIYTDATPFALPVVFPLKEEMLPAEVDRLSTLPINKIGEAIKDKIEIYYQLRHQNATGSLCILEWDSLDQGQQFYGITTIIQRVKDWCVGLITGKFPPDSEEVGFCGHFNFIHPELKFIYPEDFLNPHLIEGDLYANQTSYIEKGKIFLNDTRIYFGFHLNGLNKNYIDENVESVINFPFHRELNTSVDLLIKKPLIDNLIEKRQVIKASWFHIDTEPKPFQSFFDLVKIIGNGSYDEGIARLSRSSHEDLKSAKSFMIAIRFPNRKLAWEFQLFVIYKKENPPGVLWSADRIEYTKSLAESFEKVEAVIGEKISIADFHQRNGARADSAILQTKTVNIIGVGALGSDIADSIAKAGVGSVNLVDNQVLNAHNAVRHLAGLEFIGSPKVQAVGTIIANHNPFVRVKCGNQNIVAQDINEYIEQDSISISSIADDNIEGHFNEQAITSNKPVFYVRALRGGKVGRIFRVIPGIDACMCCLNLHRRDGKHFIDIPEDLQYPTIRNECNNPIRPASAADLKVISSIASRIVIEHMQSGSSDDNHWIWTTEAIEGTTLNRPYELLKSFIPIHSSCPYCNHKEKFEVDVKQSCVDFMRGLIEENNKIETGGVLAGYIDAEKRKMIIDFASGPGPNAKQSRTNFEKDVEFCQKFLDDLYLERGVKGIYLGEWHSHPSKDNSPSSTDIKSLTEISYQKEYLADKPVMIIFSNDGEPSCSIHPTGKSFYYAQIRIV